MRDIYEYKPDKVEGKKIIVYGTDMEAKLFALRLLNANINFDFFLYAFDNRIEIAAIYNRKVISISEIDTESSAIVTSHKNFVNVKEKLVKHKLDANLVELEVLNSDLCSRDVVIYGAGEWGQKTYEDLYSYCNISAFSDSSQGKWGTYYMGKEIIAPQSIAKECNVLITSVFFYKEIEETLRKYHIEEKYIFGDYNHLLFKESFYLHYGETVDTLNCIYGFDQAFIALLRDYENYQIVLYGEKETARQARERLKLLGFTNLDIVTRSSQSEDGTIYSLMYENEEKKGSKKYLLLDKFSVDLIRNIKQMGLNLHNFQWSENYASLYDLSYQCEHRDLLDPTSGFATISENSPHPGFVKYEFKTDSGNMPLRIVTLGGSTTSAHCVRNRPWSYYLSEKLKELHIPHVIYCGGNDSYSVSQELLRLIRDGILLEPNIVIDYSGVNNIASAPIMEDYPFIHNFQNDLFTSLEKINNIRPKAITGFYAEKKTNYGIKTEQSYAQYWYKQLRIMHSICDGEGIHFLSFLQPMLFDKADYDSDETDLLASYEIFIDAETKELLTTGEVGQDKLSAVKEFMGEAKQISEKWFYDLSNVFDNVHGVYMDYCHLYENGNQIIADHICNRLLNLITNAL